MRLKGKEALHMYQIGIDIGGTNVKIGLLDEALELTAETSVPFPHTTAADLAKKIRAAVLALLEEKNAALCDVGSLGAVVPGSIDASGETVLDAHNLDFHNVPLRKLLQEQFPGIPVYIANDANGAALAELYKGAFTGCKTGVRTSFARPNAILRPLSISSASVPKARARDRSCTTLTTARPGVCSHWPIRAKICF